jgi:hypothetical protein
MQKTFKFHAEALEVWLALCYTPRPSSNPAIKSQMGLNLAIMGDSGQVLCVLSMGREKYCQDRP